MPGANLRRWLRRPDGPEIIRQFKRLFDKAFSSSHTSVSAHISESDPGHNVANYPYNNITFSRSSIHIGNSLVLYYPSPTSSIPIAGSIQQIDNLRDKVCLHIQRQAFLPPGKHDPFRRYSHFPAKVYSSHMVPRSEAALDQVLLTSVVCHVARYNFSGDRSVIVNLSRV